MSKAEKNQNCPECGDTCYVIQECKTKQGKKEKFIACVLKDHYFSIVVRMCLDCFHKVAPNGLSEDMISYLTNKDTKIYHRGEIQDD